MGYVLLGHGELEVDSGAIPAGMEYVAIPAGTTIQFYSDTGQSLMYGSADLDVFAVLNKPWPALDSSRVTYNLSLRSARELWGEELKNNPSFGGHTLIRAGIDGPDPMLMCTGTPDTCPTDPRHIPSGATHTCDGILGTYSGELFWLACTGVEGDPTAVTAARGTAPEDVVIGQNPDVAQDDDASAAILAPFDADEADARNRDVLKALDDGDSTYFYQGGIAVLIGDGHSHAALQHLGAHGYTEGTVRIKKAGAFSKGTVYVSNSPDQRVFAEALARISDKDVEFE